MPRTAPSIRLVAHELAHGLAGCFVGEGYEFSISDSAEAAHCTMRVPRCDPLSMLANTLGGPVCDLMMGGYLEASASTEQAWGVIRAWPHAKRDWDASSDFARIERYAPALPDELLQQAMEPALQAGVLCAAIAENHPLRLLNFSRAMAMLQEGYGLALEMHDLLRLLDGHNLPVRPVYENDWLDLDAANMVAETDVDLLLAQMTAASRKQ
jgi:hypothetical protein